MQSLRSKLECMLTWRNRSRSWSAQGSNLRHNCDDTATVAAERDHMQHDMIALQQKVQGQINIMRGDGGEPNEGNGAEVERGFGPSYGLPCDRSGEQTGSIGIRTGCSISPL
jgi:hypothetical protein